MYICIYICIYIFSGRLGQGLETAVCHIRPGSWRLEAKDQCYHNGRDRDRGIGAGVVVR